MIVFTMSVSYVFFFKQKTAYEMRISDWSSDVCSSDLDLTVVGGDPAGLRPQLPALAFRVGDQEQWRGDRQRPVVGAAGELGRTHGERFLALLVERDQFEVVQHVVRARAVSGQIGRASCRARVCTYVYILGAAEQLK